MITILGIDHVVFRCRDVGRMLAFYRDVLGCPVEADQGGLVQLRAGRSMVDLVEAGPGPAGRNVDHLCLRVSPFDGEALARHLRAHGFQPGEVAPDRLGADGPGPSLYVDDPEGNTLELKGP